MSVIGVLIARREPGNPIGWLFSLAPLLVSVSLTFGAVGVWAGPQHHDFFWAAVPGMAQPVGVAGGADRVRALHAAALPRRPAAVRAVAAPRRGSTSA